MKKLLLIASVGVFLAMGVFAPSTFAQETQTGPVIQGTEVPFPFGTEIPFPWGSIEGVWEVNDRTIDAFFSFQVQRDDNGTKVLKVLHVDKLTSQVVGQGAGLADRDQKIIRAVMKGEGLNYLLFVRVFRDTKNISERVRTATVLTIRYFGTSDTNEQHYVLRKVSSTPFIVR